MNTKLQSGLHLSDIILISQFEVLHSLDKFQETVFGLTGVHYCKPYLYGLPQTAALHIFMKWVIAYSLFTYDVTMSMTPLHSSLNDIIQYYHSSLRNALKLISCSLWYPLSYIRHHETIQILYSNGFL